MKTPDYVGKDREEFLKRMLGTGPYSINFLVYEIIVLPQVFLPSTPSELMAKFIQVKKGDRIIDVGTGTGILALIAGLQGGAGYATDINPDAVKNAGMNLDKYGISGIQTAESDLFSNVPKETFDLIIFNRPFWDSYDDKRMQHTVELGFSDPTGKVLPEFLDQSKERLNTNGKILVSAAEWEDLPQVEKMFQEFGYAYTMLGKMASKRDERRVYRAYELTR
ncbi:MAG: methyltransferase [Candidatus Aenigmarchaeota archaeon]|nr:methyltransferase [Candidatus Aenigmarchaeota archaeon]